MLIYNVYYRNFYIGSYQPSSERFILIISDNIRSKFESPEYNIIYLYFDPPFVCQFVRPFVIIVSIMSFDMVVFNNFS